MNSCDNQIREADLTPTDILEVGDLVFVKEDDGSVHEVLVSGWAGDRAGAVHKRAFRWVRLFKTVTVEINMDELSAQINVCRCANCQSVIGVWNQRYLYSYGQPLPIE